MAFSIPIVKKDYDIYNSNKYRQRRLSDCSNSKSHATVRQKSASIQMGHTVSKSVGHSVSATPVGSSHVSSPRRYSTSKPPTSHAPSSSSKHDHLQKSRSLHTVDHNHHHPSNHHPTSNQQASTSRDAASNNSLARFHTKLVDRLKNSITCSSNKKSSAPTDGRSSKSTGHLDNRRS